MGMRGARPSVRPSVGRSVCWCGASLGRGEKEEKGMCWEAGKRRPFPTGCACVLRGERMVRVWGRRRQISFFSFFLAFL